MPHRLVPTLLSSSQTKAACQIQLRNRMFHCRGNRAAFGLSHFILKSSRQLRLDLAHMSCLTCLNCVCVCETGMCMCGLRVGLSECLHVVEAVEWCKSRWFWTFPGPAAQPLRVPWEAPAFMGKSRLHFRRHSRGLAKCGRVGNAENSNTRLTWGTPGPNAAGVVTSHPQWNAVLLSPTVRNPLRFMRPLPALEKCPRLADSRNY